MTRFGPGCGYVTTPKRDQKIVILDSPDGTGKTNIAHGLALDLKVPYYKPRIEKQRWREGKDAFLNELRFGEVRELETIRQFKLSMVKDRGYPSEWVYSRVFDRPTDDDLLESVDTSYAQMGAYIVIPVRHDYSKAREDDLVDRKHLPMLHETYMEFAKWSRCTTIVIYVDAFKDDLGREIKALKDELEFDGDMGWKWNKVLGEKLPEGRDVSKIFDRTLEQSDLKGVELKGKR
jgi:hypothetical protein